MFANQNNTTRLRNKFTLDERTAEFGLDDDAASDPEKTSTSGSD